MKFTFLKYTGIYHIPNKCSELRFKFPRSQHFREACKDPWYVSLPSIFYSFTAQKLFNNYHGLSLGDACKSYQKQLDVKSQNHVCESNICLNVCQGDQKKKRNGRKERAWFSYIHSQLWFCWTFYIHSFKHW